MYSKECAELIRHLDNGITAASELEAVLLQEQAALINHRVDDLQALIETKQMRVDQIQEFHSGFSAMLKISGQSVKNTWEQAKDKLCPESEIASEKSRRLEDLMWRCQTLTVENEGLVNQAMNHVNHSLYILQGLPAGDETILYGPEGSSNQPEKHSRTLGYI
jgi:flagellar biosynthesis/type III secretory pathway chaperone